jgi:hypothetical protein
MKGIVMGLGRGGDLEDVNYGSLLLWKRREGKEGR